MATMRQSPMGSSLGGRRPGDHDGRLITFSRVGEGHVQARAALTAQDLALVPLLADLDESVREDLARVSDRRTYAAGQLVILEGEPCVQVCFVLDGLVRVRQLSADGREHVLAYLGPGGTCNLIAALDGGPSLAGVDALTDVVLARVACDRFAALMSGNAAFCDATARHLAIEVRRLSEMVRSLALYNVRSRLARFLLEHVGPGASGRTGTPGTAANDTPATLLSPGGPTVRSEPGSAAGAPQRWTQDMIAARIGTVRDVVGRLLRSFASEGLIRRERGRLVIVDREALEKEALGG